MKMLLMLMASVCVYFSFLTSIYSQNYSIPGYNFLGFPFTSAKVFPSQHNNGYHDHDVSYWEVASVVRGSLNGAAPVTYTGDLEYYVARYYPNANNWDSGNSVPAHGKIRVDANKMQSGSVYWIYAKLDGEWYVAKPCASAADNIAHVSANMMWEYYSGGSLVCPSLCYNTNPGLYLDMSVNNGGPSIWSPISMKIYLPTPATVVTNLPNANVYYITENSYSDGSINYKSMRTTNTSGSVVMKQVEKKLSLAKSEDEYINEYDEIFCPFFQTEEEYLLYLFFGICE